MAERYDERRQEPRFAASGEGEVEIQGHSIRAGLIDLSINGLRMGRPAQFSPPDASRFPLKLLIPGAEPFVAEVTLIRLDSDAFSVEFMDMSPRDFSTLTGLIERYQHLLAQELMRSE